MARNEAQNQRMRDERREKFLTAALSVFSEKGLAAARMSDIARVAGSSQGLVYHYFETKEELYTALIRKAFDGMNEAARALEAMPLTPLDKVEKALTELLRLIAGHEDFSRYFMLTAQASLSSAIPAEAAAVIRQKRAYPYEVLARIFRAGQRDGTIRRHDPDELAVVFWTTIKGLAMHRAAFGEAFRAPDVKLLLAPFLAKER